MRVFSVPAAYADFLESELARIVDDIRRDEFRRAEGAEPVFPDVMIQRDRTGVAFAVVGQANDNLVAGVQLAQTKARGERRSA